MKKSNLKRALALGLVLASTSLLGVDNNMFCSTAYAKTTLDTSVSSDHDQNGESATHPGYANWVIGLETQTDKDGLKDINFLHMNAKGDPEGVTNDFHAGNNEGDGAQIPPEKCGEQIWNTQLNIGGLNKAFQQLVDNDITTGQLDEDEMTITIERRGTNSPDISIPVGALDKYIDTKTDISHTEVDGVVTITALQTKLNHNNGTDNGGYVYQDDDTITVAGTAYVDKAKAELNTKIDNTKTELTTYIDQEAAKAKTEVQAGDNISLGSTTNTPDGHTIYTVGLANDIQLKDANNNNTINISGTNGTITGLTNTAWDNSNVVAGRAATEGQLQDAEIVSGNIATDGTVTLTKGNDQTVTIGTLHDYALVEKTYSVNDENKITLDIQDKYNASNKYTAMIENVAKHSDVGDIDDIKKDGTGNTSGNTVVSNINNIYYQLESGWDAQIDGKTVNNIKMGEAQNFVTGDNMVLSADETGAIKIGTKSDVKFTTVTVGDSVTINDNGITINNGDNNVIVSKNEVNVGGNKITNVQEGAIYQGSMDAVNGGQLWQTNQRIDSLGNRVDRVGAGAAALAALHPLDFDPDDKLSFSAGVGNYAGATASAIGAFYRPDERTMFSIGGTVGNGENMINAGVSFALGKGGHVTKSRVAMAHEINDLRAQVAELTAMVSQLAAIHSNFKFDSMRPFPDTPENHWAYEYVAKLAAEGIIEGYPDGNFSGERAMTRYEYAAMLYRALQKGFAIDERLINEFEPELGRLSVERIKGELHQKNKIERVRINDQGENRDVYGGKITPGKTW